jgi:hypothetical protein
VRRLVILICITFSLLAAPSAHAVTATGVFQGASSVSSFSFPTSSVSGTSSRVRSADMTLKISSGSVPAGSTWRAHVSVLTGFSGPGGSIASSRFAVQGAAQGAGWDDLSTQRTVQTSIANTTLTTQPFLFRFIPSAGLKAGDYSGVIRVRAQQYDAGGNAGGTSDIDLSVTVHLLGNIAIMDVINVTADVVGGGTPGGSVTSVAFPTQSTVSGSKVRSDSLRVRANANTAWDLYASMDAPFTKLGDATQTKAVTSFGVCLAPCSSVSSFTGAGVLTQIANAVGSGSPASSPAFQFVSHSVSTEAGTYNGSFTLTILID